MPGKLSKRHFLEYRIGNGLEADDSIIGRCFVFSRNNNYRTVSNRRVSHYRILRSLGGLFTSPEPECSLLCDVREADSQTTMRWFSTVHALLSLLLASNNDSRATALKEQSHGVRYDLLPD